MNKEFIIASIRNSWFGSIQLAEQHILCAKMSGASAIHVEAAGEKMSKDCFEHLKKYADNINIAFVSTADSNESFELIKDNQIKIHFIDDETLKKPVMCATMLQTGIPALISIDDYDLNNLPLGNDFKNVKYLLKINNENDLPEKFEENVVGIIDCTNEIKNIVEASKRGAKIIFKDFFLDKEISDGCMDKDDLFNLRNVLNKQVLTNAL